MSGQSDKPRVYLAGPGVFRKDAKAFGEILKQKCARAGLVGCFPLDNEIAGDRIACRIVVDPNASRVPAARRFWIGGRDRQRSAGRERAAKLADLSPAQMVCGFDLRRARRANRIGIERHRVLARAQDDLSRSVGHTVLEAFPSWL